MFLSEPLWSLLWSAVFTEALAPVPDIIGVERARNDYAFIMRRFSVLINRRQESRDMTRRRREVEKSFKKVGKKYRD